MIVGVPKETYPNERRVALIPATVPSLTRARLEVVVESGAGSEAGFPDAAFEAKGARIASDRAGVFSQADLILQVRALGANPEAGRSDLQLFRAGQAVIGFCDPLLAHESTSLLVEAGVTLLSMEMMPRITRAQSMDALSSMATIAGYKAVLLRMTCGRPSRSR